MMPTWARPGTNAFCPAPWPWTSADGLSTRRYSAGRRNLLPSSKLIASSLSALLSRSSIGQRVVSPTLTSAASGGRQPLGRLFVVTQGARLVDQHDGDAVA